MIETERLNLVTCTAMHLSAIMSSERGLSGLMGAETVENWLAFPDSVPYALQRLQEDSANFRWGLHIILHRADNKIIGTCGYNGMADDDGLVEMGYAIAPSYKGQGLEAEIAKGLVDNAFRWAVVQSVDACTLPENNASGDILTGLGFKKIDEDNDLWQWRLARADYEKSKAA